MRINMTTRVITVGGCAFSWLKHDKNNLSCLVFAMMHLIILFVVGMLIKLLKTEPFRVKYRFNGKKIALKIFQFQIFRLTFPSNKTHHDSVIPLRFNYKYCRLDVDPTQQYFLIFFSTKPKHRSRLFLESLSIMLFCSVVDNIISLGCVTFSYYSWWNLSCRVNRSCEMFCLLRADLNSELLSNSLVTRVHLEQIFAQLMYIVVQAVRYIPGYNTFCWPIYSCSFSNNI